MPSQWSAVLARLGVPTGDGRIIDPAGVSFRDLPMPLMWQEKTSQGHDGAVTVGSIESVSIENGMVLGRGSLLNLFPDRDRLIELIDAGVVGPSVDISDDVEYVLDDQERAVITRAGIGGATLVPIEAFSDVSITMEPEPVGGMEVAEPSTSGLFNGQSLAAFAASDAVTVATVLPPLDWFMKPDLDRLTPLTVSDTGRVFGHIAGWESCHVGLPGCVTPPPSYSNYSYFLQSSQPLADGSVIPVGTLVAGPRHADAQLAFHAATQHYDDPTAAVARVMAGEDEFGIWVAGWVLPHAAPAARETFMSSPVSGDWRRVGGHLELIAVCSVNSAGFPIPKARVAFSGGHQRTLIGTFGVQPVSGTYEESRTSESFVRTYDADEARARWAWAQTKGR